MIMGFIACVVVTLFLLNMSVQKDVEEVRRDPNEPAVRKAMAEGYGGCFTLLMLGLGLVVFALVSTSGQ